MTSDSAGPASEFGNCCATHCFEPAEGVALATITLHPDAGAASQDDPLVVDLPMCTHHQHISRHGAVSIDLDGRLE